MTDEMMSRSYAAALLGKIAKLEAELAEARSKLRDDDRRRQFMNGKEVARAVAEERKAQEKRRGLLRRQVDDLSKRLRGQQYFADASMRAKEKLEADLAEARDDASRGHERADASLRLLDTRAEQYAEGEEENGRLHDLLRRCEWSARQGHENDMSACPTCGGIEPEEKHNRWYFDLCMHPDSVGDWKLTWGHVDDCELRAALEKTDD